MPFPELIRPESRNKIFISRPFPGFVSSVVSLEAVPFWVSPSVIPANFVASIHIVMKKAMFLSADLTDFLWHFPRENFTI